MEPLRQTGKLSDYCNDFHGWFRQCQIREGFSDFVGIYLFIDGLKPEIWEIFVDWHQYSCNRVEDAISLALKIDNNGLQDSFSPFDPESSFYNKELEWNTTITLDELMKDNAFFRNEMIQETIIDEVIDDKDLEKSEQGADDKDSLDISENIDSAYKVFDEMPEPIRDEIEAQFSDIYTCETFLRKKSEQKVVIHEISEYQKDVTLIVTNDVIVEMNDSKNFVSRYFRNEIGELNQEIVMEVSHGEVLDIHSFRDIVCVGDFWGQKSLKEGVFGMEMVIECFGWKPGWPYKKRWLLSFVFEWKPSWPYSSVGKIIKVQYDYCEEIYTALGCRYVRKEWFDDALKICRTMPGKSLMISGYNQIGKNEETASLSIEMLRENFLPTQNTFPCVFLLAGNMAAVKMGKKDHSSAVKHLGKLGVFVGNSLISCYAKCGNMEDSLLGFNKLQDLPFDPGIGFWKALLGGCHNNWTDRKSMRLKITDFELTRASTLPIKKYTCEVLNFWYRVPEVFLGATHYLEAVDMWLVGCLFAELIIASIIKSRCMAEYLEMTEEYASGNLVSITGAYIDDMGLKNLSCAVSSRQSSVSFLPISVKVNLIDRCVDIIAFMITKKSQDSVIDWWAQDIILFTVTGLLCVGIKESTFVQSVVTVAIICVMIFVGLDSWGNGTLLGTLSGNTREVLHKFTAELPKTHGQGEQSALWFVRLQMEKCPNYVRMTVELATHFYINPATSYQIFQGLSDMFAQCLQSTCYISITNAVATVSILRTKFFRSGGYCYIPNIV